MTEFLKDVGWALLGGWVIGVAFAAMRLTPPVPPLMGLIGAARVLLGGFCHGLIAQMIFRH